LAIEWQTHVFILDGDISKAYDYTKHDKVCEALVDKGANKLLVAAILREVMNKTCKLKLGKQESKEALPRTRAIWQGDPSAPHLFNATLDLIAVRFTTIAKRNKWGWPYKVGDNMEHLCLLLFADNYWLITTSPQELQAANDCWQSLLKEFGWHTDVGDLTYGSTAEDKDFLQSVKFQGKNVYRCPRKLGYKVLGTILTFNNRNDLELDRRIRAAWGAFFKHKSVLCSKACPLSKRITYFTRIVHPAFFWCTGSWNLRSDQFSKVRGAQRNMIRKMCHFKLRESEDLESFMKRSNQFINDLLERESALTWDILVRRDVFKWAGWTARLRSFDPLRITYNILLQKNWDWIQSVASQNNGRQLHGRCLKIWRWEALIYKFCRENYPDTSWVDMAQDSYEWTQLVQNLL
jgi:hypothetical protein